MNQTNVNLYKVWITNTNKKNLCTHLLTLDSFSASKLEFSILRFQHTTKTPQKFCNSLPLARKLRFLGLNSQITFSRCFLHDFHFSLPPNHRQPPPEFCLWAVAASSWSRAEFFCRRACTWSSTDCIDSSNFWSSAILAWKQTVSIYSNPTTP